MIGLGIESTAHTFGVAVIEEDSLGIKIKSNEKVVFTTEHGGMIPFKVAKHHEENKERVLNSALEKARCDLDGIEFVAFSQGPGIPPCLHVGKNFAYFLAAKIKVPLVGVNHIAAHLEIGKFCSGAKNPIFSFVSGANTQIIAFEGGYYRVFGECLSIALGNALDKFARGIGLGFPGGAKIEELAKGGGYIALPYKVKGMNLDFSGLVTKALDLHKQGAKVEDLCFSLQETCFAMLTEVTERALAHCEKHEVLLIGGVAANQRLCDMMSIMCKERDAKFFKTPLVYAGDQAGMIAYLGLLQLKARRDFYTRATNEIFAKQQSKKLLDLIDIRPRWRIDDVEVFWV